MRAGVRRALSVLLVSLGFGLFFSPASHSQPLPLAPTNDRDPSVLAPPGARQDGFGNLYWSSGSAHPRLLIAVRRDAPAYLVSSLTEDGYLRLQNQGASPSALFDQFHVGRRVIVVSREGRQIPGVVAAPNTHFRRGDDTPIPEATVDDLWVDVGAGSESEARSWGIEELCLVGAAGGAYVEGPPPCLVGPTAGTVAAQVVASAIQKGAARAGGFGSRIGSLTVAWVSQGSAGGRGVDLLVRELAPDSAVVLVPSLPAVGDSAGLVAMSAWNLPSLAGDSTSAAARAWTASWKVRPIAWSSRAARLEPMTLAFARNRIPVAQVGIPIRYAGSLGECVDGRAVNAVAAGLCMAIGVSVDEWSPSEFAGTPAGAAAGARALLRPWPAESRATTHHETAGTLGRLMAAQGISEHEGEVRAAVEREIPAGVPRWTDAHGNLIARWGSGPPERLFVAHLDEIGYRVTGADSDGRLRVEKKGGFYDWLYEGEIVRSSGPDALLGIVAPRADYLQRPRPSIDSPLSDRHRTPPASYRQLTLADVRVDPCVDDAAVRSRWLDRGVTVEKKLARLGPHRVAGRSLDDRFGCTALVRSLSRLATGQAPPRGHSILFVWSVEEETGLVGAEKLASDLALIGDLPRVVHAVDTFVSSDTPLEDARYGHARLGRGAVIRAVDTGSAAPQEGVREVREVASRVGIPLQFGITSGGNDGQAFSRWGVPNVPLAWPLRYSHTQVELADLRDLEALEALVTALARTPPGSWAPAPAPAATR